ncbi:MAG: Rieske 2Fe-2S domain-containing protein [Planctomycetota bacterium]
MTNHYAWIAWNKHKKVYDLIVAAAALALIVGFALVTILTAKGTVGPAELIMRSTAVTAIILLHVILCIGPLARLTPRFNTVLYNRRHLGVTMFLIAFVHALVATVWYAGFGAIDPVHAFLDGRSLTSVAAFPYELLGMIALAILFLMAATSHDFWLHTLSPTVWKALHMGVYVAYAALVGHVALGYLRDTEGPAVPILMGVGVVTVAGLHAAAGIRELGRDLAAPRPIDTADPASLDASEDPTDWVEVGTADDIPNNRAKVVCLANQERIAVFKHDGTVSAVSNVCKHQLGPLGEGKIVDGCITCPWHGYQYRPEDGQSPPPYTEKVATYRVRVEGRTIYVDPNALPEGTQVEPAPFEASADDTELFEEPDVERADESEEGTP